MKLFLFLLFLSSSVLARLSEDNLTWKEAKLRRAQVEGVSYDLFFEFEKDAAGFKGKSLITVDMKHLRSDLSFDFFQGKIHSLVINGQQLKKFPVREGSFDIPRRYLKKKNLIEVIYEGKYSKSASGLKRVKDPQDGAEYIYTDFEPYYAHWLFPCFDQPDLKARYKVSVLAPSDWRVIQNELLESESKEGEKKRSIFRETPPLSPYLFFLGAGPFVEWKDTYGELPLYLWARKSMEKYVDVDRLMETTKKGLKFFNDYFGYSYPFSKYGQIFIPEFAWGGMENPGAVTLNERNIFRGPVPKIRYDKRDGLILHEMAHMWFGDLVTMEWWNDLWLNESFASYLASVAQERALQSDDSWLDFFSSKTWGYWQDQLITTHSIETPVKDIREARGNFDGITYAKGGAALKQLHFFAGENGFREGLKNYFKTYAWKNTTREDFINSIGQASGQNLKEWTHAWLQTRGPNRVKVEFHCNEGRISALKILQSPSISGTVSPHRVRLAYFKKDDDELALLGTEDVTYERKETPVVAAVGKKCPDFIFPNYTDQDYALFSLDEKSLKLAPLALEALPDGLSRFMIWHILGQMVRDGELKVATYMEMALKGLEVEEDDHLLGNLLSRHSTIRRNYGLYLTPAERSELAPRFEGLLLKKLLEAKTGSSRAMNVFDFFVSVAQTPEAQEKIHGWLVKNNPPDGIVLDQDRRWNLLLSLATHGHKDALQLVSEEVKKDNSTQGQRNALAARAAFPELDSKKKVWEELFRHKEISHNDLEEAAGRFHHANYPELTRHFVKDYFSRMQSFKWKDHDDLVEIYFDALFPLEACTPELAKLSQGALKSAKGLTSLARRGWLESQDELERCVRVRAKI